MNQGLLHGQRLMLRQNAKVVCRQPHPRNTFEEPCSCLHGHSPSSRGECTASTGHSMAMSLSWHLTCTLPQHAKLQQQLARRICHNLIILSIRPAASNCRSACRRSPNEPVTPTWSSESLTALLGQSDNQRLASGRNRRVYCSHGMLRMSEMHKSYTVSPCYTEARPGQAFAAVILARA